MPNLVAEVDLAAGVEADSLEVVSREEVQGLETVMDAGD
jgi:hypothetical protein